jgi:hypothetical protein
MTPSAGNGIRIAAYMLFLLSDGRLTFQDFDRRPQRM